MALTAAQIVEQACRIAKAPSFTTIAGEWLNMILQELCQNYDFDTARSTYNFTTTGSAGPYAMPSTYLRAKYRDVFFTINGVQYFPIFIDQARYDTLVQTPGMMSYPTYFATDASASPINMYLWPPPSGAYVFTVRYYRQMADITTPATSTDVPWFPNTNYLVTRLAGEMMKVTNDDRAGGFLSNAEAILDRYLKMKDDHNGKAMNVDLDRSRFRGPGRLLPNTKQLGWGIVFAAFSLAALVPDSLIV